MALKNLIKRNVGDVVDDLPPHVVSERLKTLFKNYIGRNNTVTMPEIYEHVFGHSRCSKLQYIFRCQKIMGVMTWLKKKTHYFIVGEKIDDEYVWYIVKTAIEAYAYKDQVDKKIRGLNYMKRRCDKAVAERFYRKLDVPVRRQIRRAY